MRPVPSWSRDLCCTWCTPPDIARLQASLLTKLLHSDQCARSKVVLWETKDGEGVECCCATMEKNWRLLGSGSDSEGDLCRFQYLMRIRSITVWQHSGLNVQWASIWQNNNIPKNPSRLKTIFLQWHREIMLTSHKLIPIIFAHFQTHIHILTLKDNDCRQAILLECMTLATPRSWDHFEHVSGVQYSFPELHAVVLVAVVLEWMSPFTKDMLQISPLRELSRCSKLSHSGRPNLPPCSRKSATPTTICRTCSWSIS